MLCPFSIAGNLQNNLKAISKNKNEKKGKASKSMKINYEILQHLKTQAKLYDSPLSLSHAHTHAYS